MAANREFFAVRSVSEALAGFRPARRTAQETVEVTQAAARVPARDVAAPAPLPGFARATVDGYAVRAADTYGASEGLPSYLHVRGAVRMGSPPEASVTAGTAVAVPTGAVLPAGADAVVMVEHTQEPFGDALEVMRPVAPGDGVVRADDDVPAGGTLAQAGRPLRAADLGLLSAAGITEIEVHARPRVAVLSTGDEVVPPGTRVLRAGQVRDATAAALGAMVRDAGGVPVGLGIVADEAGALEAALRRVLARADVVVVSAGSSVGTRDETAAVIASLGEPGIWCHGLAIKPGKPTLLAECGDVPVIGLPGNPRSALVVFRVVGAPVVRLVGGVRSAPPEPRLTARLARDLPSASGRLDVVPVELDAHRRAVPLFGASALLSVLARADGLALVPEDANGLAAGSEVEVLL